MNLTLNELSLFVIVTIILFGVLLFNYSRKIYYGAFSPLTFHVATLIYYVVIGPIVLLINNATFMRLVEHRSYFGVSWLACIVSMISLLAGFYFKRSISKRNIIEIIPSDSKISKICLWIFIIVIVAFAIYTKGNILGRIKFLEYKADGNIQDVGSLSGYLMLSINMLMVPVLLLLILFLKKKSRLLFISMLLIAVSLYINEAFRYRLVMLIIGLISTFCLYKRTKPNPVFLVVLFLLFATFMGVMEKGRGYGRGLDVDKLKDDTEKNFLRSGFNDASIFMGSGFLIQKTSESGNFTGLAFLYNALAAPIPRAIWPNKPDGGYILNAWTDLYGSQGSGQAFLYYGEYFIIFGWIGIIVLSFILGVLYKTVWLYFLLNQDHPFAIVALSVFNGFIYVTVSRGYFSQQVTMFFFTVFPIFYLIAYLKKHQDKNIANI